MKVNLEWNLGKIQPSDLYKVSIAIKSDYQWGEGWTAQQANRFENEVYQRLMKEGFNIKYPKDRDRSIRVCPTLVSDNPHDKTSLYMHPMEFSGYMSKADCDKVVRALNDCQCIYGVEIAYQKECYDISDALYEEMIFENLHNIVDGFPKYCKENSFSMNAYTMQEYAFECVQECRLPRLGDHAGFTSDDVDVKAIVNMLKTAKELGYYEKSMEKTKVQQKRSEGIDR